MQVMLFNTVKPTRDFDKFIPSFLYTVEQATYYIGDEGLRYFIFLLDFFSDGFILRVYHTFVYLWFCVLCFVFRLA